MPVTMRSGLVAIALLLLSQPVLAQDYRIYTLVSLQDNVAAESALIGRSLTIWHAGKVFDYMETVGEVVIYDQQADRYTLINGPHKIACTLEFGELRQYLKVARTEAEKYIQELVAAAQPGSEYTIAKVRFQLDPTFQFRFDTDNKILSCQAEAMSYEVYCREAPNADLASAFRQYADSAAQLNFVLHGNSMMPQARMLVNEQLAQKNWIPLKVKLSLNDPRQTVLTAEHSIKWELGSAERSRLLEWKSLQQNESLKYVSFQEYQRHLLTQFQETR